MERPGTVYLVGAGPGDPGLFTVRGMQLLGQADVVLYDRLVDERLLQHVPAGAEVVYVGKWPRSASNTQEEINGFLIQRARQGKRVVRLKGGDPFVFGRGGEEAQALAEAGIPFEVVPGVTSAIAVPAYAGIPLTHRQIASSFTVISGSEDPAKEESAINWKALATGAGTLVVLMGWESLPQVVDALLAHGMPASTPAALIQWGTEPHQRTVEGTLGTILDRGRREGLEPPVVAVFGQVVALRQSLRWFDNRPLFGKRVLVTRSRAQASNLADLLAEAGAEPLEVPTIQVQPLEDVAPLLRAARDLPTYRWVVFSSANGVEAFWRVLETEGLDARAFASASIAAIGPATAEALARRGLRADLVPHEYVSEAMAREFEGRVRPGERVLLVRAEEAREVLPVRLRALGAEVDALSAYRLAVPEGSQEGALGLLEEGDVDLVTFTSSSTVRNLVSLLPGKLNLLERPRVACIGPVTAAAARELGLRVDIQARQYTIAGLVEAIKQFYVEQGARTSPGASRGSPARR
ncbi:MAG: uroporphyrinogen-III C-methyltransferase [Chloroflexi bacterium]|nr:uroporphyrinogen-III C-methyltransferase [Chloroflexota bacterium]